MSGDQRFVNPLLRGLSALIVAADYQRADFEGWSGIKADDLPSVRAAAARLAVSLCVRRLQNRSHHSTVDRSGRERPVARGTARCAGARQIRARDGSGDSPLWALSRRAPGRRAPGDRALRVSSAGPSSAERRAVDPSPASLSVAELRRARPSSLRSAGRSSGRARLCRPPRGRQCRAFAHVEPSSRRVVGQFELQVWADSGPCLAIPVRPQSAHFGLLVASTYGVECRPVVDYD